MPFIICLLKRVSSLQLCLFFSLGLTPDSLRLLLLLPFPLLLQELTLQFGDIILVFPQDSIFGILVDLGLVGNILGATGVP